MNSKEKTKPDLGWLSQTDVFAMNRLKAHSDHVYYETSEEARAAVPMKMRHSLNRNWKFHYAVNPFVRPADFIDDRAENFVWPS